VPPFTVLQVCMGNICRSPMAERLLVLAARNVVGDKAEDLLHVHSTGVGDWHAGAGMDTAAARQVRRRGGDPDSFVARTLRAEHIEASDLILTATADQQQHVVSMRPDAASRTFVLSEFGRLLRAVDLNKLPPAVADRYAVYIRGSALVAAVQTLRGGKPPRPADDLDDPWGRSDLYFSRVADQIEETVRPLAIALLSP
jgi:protein-tyrosine phosphatase